MMSFFRTLACYLAAPGVRFWAMVGAAISLNGFAGWLVWIIWHGGWPLSQAGRQLDILGKALWLTLGMILIIVVALTDKIVRAVGFNSSIDIGRSDSPERKDPGGQ